MSLDPEHVRMAEALLFASKEPLDEAALAERLPEGADIPAILATIEEHYRHKGVNLTRLAGKWTFLTAPDLSWLLEEERETTRRLSRAALETLAIIAYHQPVTRAEIEEIRGVGLSRGTMDVLFDAGWIRPRGRRRTPGRPVTYGVTEDFLIHFGLDDIKDLPGFDEMKAAGLLNTEPTGIFRDLARANEEEDSLEDPEEEEL
ncbi:SMC-Scp complex subunit ScpB [Sneathiella sp. CAU 1612]|uniref:SMC-Scp complex subunit ScpB n=1 Tax=Sneathiella sedimenti TaxID=2816034 RepID=A0ABS3F7Z1_9PROT|nr:SMC-Scp complex subunit ScpB [Sneathiella sedimenti]MBO0334635.1 SMC-Scp complex subunit ScpB [Sneathiella sedimenti]